MPGTKLKNATDLPIILFGKTIRAGKISEPLEDRLLKHASVRQLILRGSLVSTAAEKAAPAPAAAPEAPKAAPEPEKTEEPKAEETQEASPEAETPKPKKKKKKNRRSN